MCKLNDNESTMQGINIKLIVYATFVYKLTLCIIKEKLSIKF